MPTSVYDGDHRDHVRKYSIVDPERKMPDRGAPQCTVGNWEGLGICTDRLKGRLSSGEKPVRGGGGTSNVPLEGGGQLLFRDRLKDEPHLRQALAQVLLDLLPRSARFRITLRFYQSAVEFGGHLGSQKGGLSCVQAVPEVPDEL